MGLCIGHVNNVSLVFSLFVAREYFSFIYASLVQIGNLICRRVRYRSLNSPDIEIMALAYVLSFLLLAHISKLMNVCNMIFTPYWCRYWPCQSSRSDPLLPLFLRRLLDKLWNRGGWSRGYSAVPRGLVHPHGRVHEDVFVMEKFENLLRIYLNISISMDTMCLNYFVLHYVLTSNTTSFIKPFPP